MIASTATDAMNGVEYYFEETSGNSGGSDSSWQSSAVYEDTGLQAETTYTYRVKARDTSTNHNETGFTASKNATTPKDSGGNIIASEDFETGLTQLSNVSGDDIDWTHHSGSTVSSSTGPSQAHEGNYYVYLEASSPNYPAKTAFLETGDLGGQALDSASFYYHMYGGAMGTLDLEYYNGSSWQSLWNKTGQQHSSDTESWTQVTVDLSSYSIQKLRFKGVTGNDYTSDIALDQFVVIGGSSSLNSTEDFETGLITWKNSSGDDMDWSRHSGSTVSSNTGPSQSYDGSYYVYMEASQPNYPGKAAYLESVVLTSQNVQSVSFYYHMYGAQTGSLSLECDTGSGWQTVWSKVGEQQNSSDAAWTKADVGLVGPLSSNTVQKLRFKGVTGSDWESDIALDLITLSTSSVDNDPPVPNPMTWAVDPMPSSPTSIRMTASTATDVSDVEYYFENIPMDGLAAPGSLAGTGHNSGWQDSPVYEDTALQAGYTYGYRVKARDKSSNHNETISSSLKTVTLGGGVLVPDPMTWSSPPAGASSSSISMGASIASIALTYSAAYQAGANIEYYFEETSGNIGGSDSSWQSSRTYSDTGLQTGATYTYRVKARLIHNSQVVTETGWSISGNAQPTGGSAGDVFSTALSIDSGVSTNGDTSSFNDDYNDYAGCIWDESGPDVVYTFTSTASGDISAALTNDSSVIDVFILSGPSASNTLSYSEHTATVSNASAGTYYVVVDGYKGGMGSYTLTVTYQGGVDTTPPDPDPLPWNKAPWATGPTSIKMESTIATDASGVEYYFEETSGRSGGNDSGWTDSHIYEDTGLLPNTVYTYRVKARDKSSNKNTTGLSASKSATTPPFGDQIEDFESGLVTWGNAGSDDLDWTVHSGGTQSTDTGPSQAHDGSNYVYVESSQPNYPAKTAYLESGDLSSQTIGSISFYYHMYGGDMGILSLEYYDGSNWQSIWSKSGQQHSSYTDSWTQATVDLSNYTIKKLRFKGVTGNSYTSDMALDLITLSSDNALPNESFEADFTSWLNKTGDDIDWTRHSGSTNSTDTGPSQAHDGTYYAYVEASSPNNPGKTAYLESVDLSSHNPIGKISFYYHMYGSDMGLLSLEYYDGSNWQNLWSKTGQQHSSSSASWTKAEVGLASYTVQKLRFVGVTGTSYDSDIAIDLVELTEYVPDTTAPTPDPLTWSQEPLSTGSTSVQMIATSATDESQVEYFFECVSGGGHDSGWQDSGTYEDTNLLPDTSYSYKVKARDKSPNQNETGWSSTKATTTDPDNLISKADFETDLGTWTNASGDDIEWARHSGNTPSSNTGPTQAHTGTYYVYVEASDPNYPNKTAFLESSDLSSANVGSISFYYHMYGQDMGSLSVETYDGSSWHNVWNKTGQQHSSSDNAWTKAEIDLSPYVVHKVRLVGITGTSYYSDICVDLMVIEKGGDDDLAPTPDPLTWSKAPYATGSDSVKMVAGTATDKSGVEYYFECTSGGGHNSGWQDSTTYEDTLLQAETTYKYRVKARDKSINKNETGWSAEQAVTTENANLLSSESFETDFVSWTNTTSGDDIDWTRIIGNTPSTDTGPSQAHEGSYYAYVEASSPNYPSKKAYLESSDLGSHTIGTVVFYYHMYGSNMGTLSLDYYDGSSWQSIWSKNGEQHNGIDALWTKAEVGLSSYSVQKLRFSGETGSDYESDIAIDFIKVFIGTEDKVAPTPDPMTWSQAPASSGKDTITMVASTASDPAGVEYYFECTSGGGNSSSWQDSASYTDTSLLAGRTYTYKVKTRDKSPNQNETGWSGEQSATTDPDVDATPPNPDPLAWAQSPTVSQTSISLTATTATDDNGVEYFFECTSGGGNNSSWQDGTTYVDTGLQPGTTCTYRVQARDKSPSQNATGWSVSVTATTVDNDYIISGTVNPSGATVELFLDGAKIGETNAANGNYQFVVPDMSDLYQVRAYKFVDTNNGWYPTCYPESGSGDTIVFTGNTAIVDLVLDSVSLTSKSENSCDFYGGAQHLGASALVGDVVTAKDNAGNLCGVYIVKKEGKFGILTVLGAESGKPELGPEEGESISFYINKTLATIDDPSKAVFVDGNEESVVLSTGGGGGTQVWVVDLHPTWNCITIGVNPTSTNPADVFSTVNDKIKKVRMYSSEGIKVYIPTIDPDFWTLTSVETNYAYQVYANEACTLIVSGTAVASTTQLQMHATWNVVPFYGGSGGKQSVDTYYQPIFSKMKKIRWYSPDGIKVCIPTVDKDYWTLTDLEFPFGYQIYMNEDATFAP